MYKKASTKLITDDEKSTKTASSLVNTTESLNNQIENLINIIQNNKTIIESFETQDKTIKEFIKTVKDQDYYQILKIILPVTIDIFSKLPCQQNNPEEMIRENKSLAHHRVASFSEGIRHRNNKSQSEKTNEKVGLKHILVEQNQILFQINKDMLNTVSKFNTVRDKKIFSKDKNIKNPNMFCRIKK